MGIFVFFAGFGLMFDDILAMTSVIGSAILFVGSLISKQPSKKFGEIKSWTLAGFVFGAFGQFSIAITGMSTEKIGIVFSVSPLIVNGLLFLSFLLLLGRWIIRRNRR